MEVTREKIEEALLNVGLAGQANRILSPMCEQWVVEVARAMDDGLRLARNISKDGVVDTDTRMMVLRNVLRSRLWSFPRYAAGYEMERPCETYDDPPRAIRL